MKRIFGIIILIGILTGFSSARAESVNLDVKVFTSGGSVSVRILTHEELIERKILVLQGKLLDEIEEQINLIY